MRLILLVIDSFGIGALPDAKDYNDENANTALHIATAVSGAKWPTLKKLGLGNASDLLQTVLPGCEMQRSPLASFGVMAEQSIGKDTAIGHWEMAGVPTTEPFHVFPTKAPVFPKALTDELSNKTGYTFIGNRVASGTEIIQELGQQHLVTKQPIIYTSSDSVFQIAAHESIFSQEDLYRICEHARHICNKFNVGRVIARPFIGFDGKFSRTSGRKDFAIELSKESILDHLQQHNIKTIGVGKIGDIFSNKGLDLSYPEKGNFDCIQRVENLLSIPPIAHEFIFINLVDTDMLYGHRRNPHGYHDEIIRVDTHIQKLINSLPDSDMLIITADHGCDPTHRGTDHTREYVPLLMYQKGIKGRSLGIRNSFSDIAASVSDFFQCPDFHTGQSFLNNRVVS